MNEAIKLAIEKGGYEYDEAKHNHTGDIALTNDPLFWQALGKALRWEKTFTVCLACGGTYYTVEKNPFKRRQCEHEKPVKDVFLWLYHWHRFIDHIAEGKDADSFFKELIK